MYFCMITALSPALRFEICSDSYFIKQYNIPFLLTLNPNICLSSSYIMFKSRQYFSLLYIQYGFTIQIIISNMDFRDWELEVEKFFSFDEKQYPNFLFQNDNQSEEKEDYVLSPSATAYEENINTNKKSNFQNNQKEASVDEIFKAKKKTNRQSNPNLIKNLVGTLRTWIKIETTENNYAKQIWEYFVKSKKINQKLLRICFGAYDQTWSQIVIQLEKQHNELLCLNMDARKLFSAQQYLRNEVIQQIERQNIEYIIQNRRIKDKIEFRKYFYEFMAEIKGGGIRRTQKKAKSQKSKATTF